MEPREKLHVNWSCDRWNKGNASLFSLRNQCLCYTHLPWMFTHCWVSPTTNSREEPSFQSSFLTFQINCMNLAPQSCVGQHMSDLSLSPSPHNLPPPSILCKGSLYQDSTCRFSWPGVDVLSHWAVGYLQRFFFQDNPLWTRTCLETHPPPRRPLQPRLP